MNRLTIFFAGLAALLFFWACTKRMICPAFQSAFIYDEEALRQKFSYFNADSIPKKLTASKTKYLIITSKSYKKRLKSLRTVEMKKIYPVDSLQTATMPVKDTLLMQRQDSLFGKNELLSSIADSLANDNDASTDQLTSSATRDSSYYEITLAKEKYNTDQDNYMWYLRDILLLPDVRIALYKKNEPPTEKEPLDTLRQKKKKSGLRGRGRKKDKKGKKATLATPSPASDSTGVKQLSPN